MARSMNLLLLMLLPLGCAGTPGPDRGGTESPAEAAAAPAATPAPPPAPVLDTPSNVPDRLWVHTPRPALTLRIDPQRVTLVQDGRTRELTVDKNDLVFAGRHVMAHDDAGAVEVLVAGQLCQDPASGEWVPYSARVTINDGEFIFGCAGDAPPP